MSGTYDGLVDLGRLIGLTGDAAIAFANGRDGGQAREAWDRRDAEAAALDAATHEAVLSDPSPVGQLTAAGRERLGMEVGEARRWAGMHYRRAEATGGKAHADREIAAFAGHLRRQVREVVGGQ